ncbi:hypothetical protein SAQ01S_09270 [Sphingomonas aquatilis NBRC 16722]|nr:hypothetical protein SAQ01S_09270 [Sphingomonas aquatilis NBRC 16722]
MDLAGQAVLGKPIVGPGIGALGESGRGKKARDRGERSEAHHSYSFGDSLSQGGSAQAVDWRRMNATTGIELSKFVFMF